MVDRLPSRPPEGFKEKVSKIPAKREKSKNKAVKLRKSAEVGEKPIPWGAVVFDGYGKVSWNDKEKKLTMAPMASVTKRENKDVPQETHGALVLSNESYNQPFQLSYTMKTTKQLRQNEPPNDWEVGWAVFGAKADGKFKYTVLKPNGSGLEIGESLLNDAQEFLYTSEQGKDQFPINKDYNVVMRVENNVVSLSVNGKQYPPYNMSADGAKDHLTPDGKFGFYTEDAEVQVSNVKMVQLPKTSDLYN